MLDIVDNSDKLGLLMAWSNGLAATNDGTRCPVFMM